MTPFEPLLQSSSMEMVKPKSAKTLTRETQPKTHTPAATSLAKGHDSRASRYIVAMEKILREKDVRRVVKLRETPAGWVYMIETPFDSFPKFVIGSASSDFSGVLLLHRSGCILSAMNDWTTRADADELAAANLDADEDAFTRRQNSEGVDNSIDKLVAELTEFAIENGALPLVHHKIKTLEAMALRIALSASVGV